MEKETPEELDFVKPDGFEIADKTLKNGVVGEYTETPGIGDDPTAYSSPSAPGVIVTTAGTTSPETPTEEWEKIVKIAYGTDARGRHYVDLQDLRPVFDDILSSRDAELRRKIEGMPIRSYNISATQIRQFVDRDSVLALFDKENV